MFGTTDVNFEISLVFNAAENLAEKLQLNSFLSRLVAYI